MTDKFAKYFSEASFWEKLKAGARQAGDKVVYVVLLLFYVLQDKSVSLQTKLTVSAALGYFIFPTDAIIDFTPFIGYSDDLGVLLFTLAQVAENVSDDIKNKSKEKCAEWFGRVDDADLPDVDDFKND